MKNNFSKLAVLALVALFALNSQSEAAGPRNHFGKGKAPVCHKAHMPHAAKPRPVKPCKKFDRPFSKKDCNHVKPVFHKKHVHKSHFKPCVKKNPHFRQAMLRAEACRRF